MDVQFGNLFRRPKEIMQLLNFLYNYWRFSSYHNFTYSFYKIPTDMLLASLIPLFIFLILPSYQLFINIPRYIIIDENHTAFIIFSL